MEEGRALRGGGRLWCEHTAAVWWLGSSAALRKTLVTVLSVTGRRDCCMPLPCLCLWPPPSVFLWDFGCCHSGGVGGQATA